MSIGKTVVIVIIIDVLEVMSKKKSMLKKIKNWKYAPCLSLFSRYECAFGETVVEIYV